MLSIYSIVFINFIWTGDFFFSKYYRINYKWPDTWSFNKNIWCNNQESNKNGTNGVN